MQFKKKTRNARSLLAPDLSIAVALSHTFFIKFKILNVGNGPLKPAGTATPEPMAAE